MALAYWLNSAWMLKCAGERTAFRRAMRRVEFEQTNVLRDILRANRDSEFGRAHRFATISTPREFQDRVPLSCYDDYRAAIERIAAGRANVLTAEPVRLFEPTSGSSGPEKLIPFTRGLRRQFQRGVAAWVGDLLSHRPALRGGRAYWSISPAFGPVRRTAGGIAIGFDEDAAYLGGFEQWALRRLLVAPAALSRVHDLENFRYATLLYLAAASDLTLVSVWSPTFLTRLLDSLEPWSDRLAHDLRIGAVSLPNATQTGKKGELRLRSNPRRASELAAIFRAGGAQGSKLRQIWPRLALVSCWGDAAAAIHLRELQQTLPDVEIQPKGLLATEGIVSIPQVDCSAPALAVRSHFFEFIDAESDSDRLQGSRQLRLAHELEQGGRYRIVLTTAGGLYRYLLGDEVEVAGFAGDCPLLRFMGRGDRVSDLVGEKLAEPHVRAVLDAACQACGVTPRFAMLAPADNEPARYQLFLQLRASDSDSARINALQQAVELGLGENPHYRYAVGVGQLAPFEICLLDPAAPSAWCIYENACLAHGQKVGNIKPVALAAGSSWQAAFRPLQAPPHAPATADTPI